MTPRRATATLFITFFLLVSSFFAVLTYVPMTARAAILYVGGVGPGNYTSIQAAVDAANPGDTVFVFSGYYLWQNANLNKPINLIGENKSTTIIDPDPAMPAVYVTSDWVNVSGFTAKKSISLGSIVLSSVQNCRIVDNIALNDFDPGIYLTGSSNNMVANNTASASLDSGIYLSFSNDNTIANNSVSGSDHGIYVWVSDRNIIANNTVTTSEWNGIYLMYADNSVVYNNTVSQNQQGIALYISNENRIERNTIVNNPVGIGISESNKNVVSGNAISNNSRGIHPSLSYDSTIVSNQVTNNTYGIVLQWYLSANTTIVGNSFVSNEYGVRLDSSSGNRVYHNNFIDNANQSYDSGSNSWDDGYPSGGNYWSDYSGSDIFRGPNQDQPGSDGIGDIPHPIPGGTNKDRYPFRTPIGCPLPDLVVAAPDVSFFPTPPIAEDSSVLVNVSIRNLGMARSGPTVVRFHDGPPPSPQIGLDQSLASIPAGGSANASVSWIPLTAGSHDICVVVDPENLVTETSETNNMACVPVRVLSIPDLVPTSLVIAPPSPLPEGTVASVNVTVANTGDLSAGESDVLLFDDSNGNLAPDPGEEIGVQALAGIAGHAQSYARSVWTASMVGTHTLCAYVDPPPGAVNESNEMNNIACTNVDVIFVRQLTPGHWFMSFPSVVANDSVDSVLSSISRCYDYVRWYDALDATNHWKSYVPGRTFSSFLRLDNRMGFWINVTSNCGFAPVGTRPSSTTIDFHQGWNMVGFPSFNTTYTVADLKADIGLAGIVVEAFDAGASPYYLQRVGDGYVMMAGEGYWIYVPSDTTWIVNG